MAYSIPLLFSLYITIAVPLPFRVVRDVEAMTILDVISLWYPIERAGFYFWDLAVQLF